MSPSPTHLLEAIEICRSDDAAGEGASTIDLKSFSLDELKTLVVEGFGEKAFRGEQLYRWMHFHYADSFDEMTNLSKDFRAKLERVARVSPLTYIGATTSEDGTAKHQFRCDDGAVIESVFLPFGNHNSLCVSSQVGCAMGCTFCYTAKMGLSRNLSVAEIVDQAIQVRRLAKADDEGVSNVVFMGMGEPLHNTDNVIRSCAILTDDKGLNFSRRKVTVSTSGLVPEIKRLMAESDVQLAVSLNATTDETRSKIMPINDRYGLDELMGALRNLSLDRRQRVTFEYVLLKGVNDSIADAKRIVQLVHGIPCKVNIIPFNPHPETPFDIPEEETVEAFQRYLIDHHVSCFRRKTKGREGMAACGQLGKPSDKKPPRHLRKRLEALHDELG